MDRRIGGGNIDRRAVGVGRRRERDEGLVEAGGRASLGVDQGHGEAGLNQLTGERQGGFTSRSHGGDRDAEHAQDLFDVADASGGGRAVCMPASAQTPGKKPNILFIMGDDVGWFNIGAYHQGIMSGKTPNLDKLAAEGMRFTDYYAEASCTAGRANFITGEIPLRTGLTTVGQAGADVGIPAQACTLATALKAQGYATGQFGKNHLGDLNKFLPTVHGFDEFFGYLYHLDAMSDPYWYLVPGRRGLSTTSTARAAWCTATRPTRTTQPRCRAGARSASRRSLTKARCRRSRTCRTCRTCTICRS